MKVIYCLPRPWSPRRKPESTFRDTHTKKTTHCAAYLTQTRNKSTITLSQVELLFGTQAFAILVWFLSLFWEQYLPNNFRLHYSLAHTSVSLTSTAGSVEVLQRNCSNVHSRHADWAQRSINNFAVRVRERVGVTIWIGTVKGSMFGTRSRVQTVNSISISWMLISQWNVKSRWLPMENNFARQF